MKLLEIVVRVFMASAWLIATLAALVLLPFALFIMLCIGVLAWAFGAHVKVKQNGAEIGYVRWFKFHRYDHRGLAGPYEITRR